MCGQLKQKCDTDGKNKTFDFESEFIVHLTCSSAVRTNLYNDKSVDSITWHMHLLYYWIWNIFCDFHMFANWNRIRLNVMCVLIVLQFII